MSSILGKIVQTMRARSSKFVTATPEETEQKTTIQLDSHGARQTRRRAANGTTEEGKEKETYLREGVQLSDLVREDLVDYRQRAPASGGRHGQSVVEETGR